MPHVGSFGRKSESSATDKEWIKLHTYTVRMSEKRRRSADEMTIISFGENSRCGDPALTGKDASTYWFVQVYKIDLISSYSPC
jgi:hypothetical protein